MFRMPIALIGAVVVLAATPAPQSTPPPQIYHIVTRPLCAELHDRIAPAIGMMLENDATIKKSPVLFRQYNDASLNGQDAGDDSGPEHQNNPAAGDPGGESNSQQNLALLGLENLIRPIANNIIAIQTVLDSPELLHGTGRPDDDKKLQEIREKLLKALAVQNASLDIISGFVDTQQMADLQHEGEAYISSFNQPDTSGAPSTPAPINPLMSNPNAAGIPQNPYNIDPTAIPGLALGYNPITRLIGALHWTIDTTETRENDAAKTVMSNAALCGEVRTAPSPTP